MYHKYLAYVDNTELIDKPKYYEEIEDIFGYGQINNPNEVQSSGQTQFQSSTSTAPLATNFVSSADAPTMAISPNEKLVHIKNEYPMKTSINDYKITFGIPIQPKM